MKGWKELNHKVSRKLPCCSGLLCSCCQTTDDLIAMTDTIGQNKYRIDEETGHAIVIDFSQGLGNGNTGNVCLLPFEK